MFDNIMKQQCKILLFKVCYLIDVHYDLDSPNSESYCHPDDMCQLARFVRQINLSELQHFKTFITF